jgi:hypothetical protein
MAVMGDTPVVPVFCQGSDDLPHAVMEAEKLCLSREVKDDIRLLCKHSRTSDVGSATLVDCLAAHMQATVL